MAYKIKMASSLFAAIGSRFAGVSSTLCRSLWFSPLVNGISTSMPRYGLEEFFPKEEDVLEDSDKIGRSWRARELRLKSNEDLHKLWYVLLKERNMLLTMRHEANRRGFIMPTPERLWKVKRSMARIKVVIGERERAIKGARDAVEKQEKEFEATEEKEQEKVELPPDKHENLN